MTTSSMSILSHWIWAFLWAILLACIFQVSSLSIDVPTAIPLLKLALLHTSQCATFVVLLKCSQIYMIVKADLNCWLTLVVAWLRFDFFVACWFSAIGVWTATPIVPCDATGVVAWSNAVGWKLSVGLVCASLHLAPNWSQTFWMQGVRWPRRG